MIWVLIAFVSILVFVGGVKLGNFIWNVIKNKRTAKSVDQPIVIVKKIDVETYGHDIDILAKVKNSFPNRPQRLMNTRWDISVDIAGEVLNDENGKVKVDRNDSMLRIKFIDVRNTDPIAEVVFNLTRYYDEHLKTYFTYKKAFVSETVRHRNGAKACQNQMITEITEWAGNCQDEYEYEYCPPEPVVQIV